MKPLGKEYKEAEANTGEFQKLPAGGYVVKVIEATDVPEKAHLAIIYDIAEGVYKNYYGDDWGKEHPFAHKLAMFYTPKALGVFKGNLKAFDESNGTDFEKQAEKGLDEKKLVGKLVGLVLGYEEYESNTGERKERIYVKSVLPVQRIRDGKFKVPELKTLDGSAPSAPSVPPVEMPEGFGDGSDIPF